MKSLILLFTFLIHSIALLSFNPQDEFQPFTIKAKLVNENGVNVKNEKVYCFIFIKGIAYSNLGLVNGKAGCIDPSGITNENGDVKINVPSDFIKKHKNVANYTIGIIVNGKPAPAFSKGKQVVFDLDLVKKSKNVIDFGKVIVNKKP